MIDCGKCGYEQMRQQEGGGYVCGHCGKTYTKEEAEQRQQALDRLDGLRRLQLIFMGCTMLLLVVAAILLPGYVDGTGNNVLMYTVTGLCLAAFLAALTVRILFGRERKKLYPRT